MAYSAAYDFPVDNDDGTPLPENSTHYYSTLKHSQSAENDVILNDQSARLVICTTPYGELHGTSVHNCIASHSPSKDVKIYSLENTPLLTNSSREVSAPSTAKCKVQNVMDYRSTTTVTTTTKTTIPAELIQLETADTLSSDKDVWQHRLHAPYVDCGCLVDWGGECNCAVASVESHKRSTVKPLLLVLPNHEYKSLNQRSLVPMSAVINKNSDSKKREGALSLATAAPVESTSSASAQAIADGERDMWENKTDFLLSVIGFAVDLANVWRFPYLCFKNGGGAFLIPYIIMVVFAGIPLFYMELALGQYYRKGAITTWGKICPLFKGIGYCVIMTAFYTDFFYNVIIAFALHYLFASFNTLLPWASCSNAYNSPACYEPSWSTDGDSSSRECATSPVFINSSAFNSSLRAVSAAEEYFYKYFLGLHEEKAPVAHVVYSLDNLGGINWELVACVFIIYLICYFSLWKGIKMSGKVVWFTAIFPYIVLGVLLIRGITLPGWEKGIEYYLRPNIEMLKIPSVWQDAATQVFFSLGPGFGVLLAYSSYNEFHNNVYFDALLTSSINCMTSFLAGFVIFSILGYMSCKSGKPIHEVAQEGPGLAFVVYPEALATMPGASLWSIAFFLMLLTLGLDSSFGGSEAIITALSDEFPIIKRNREIFVALLFIFYMIIGLAMCTHGGMLVMEWLIFYGTAWGLLIAVFCETMVISFCYGIKQFSDDIREMLGFGPGWYWKICWTIGAPSFLIAMIMSSFINYQHLQYQDYVYSDLSNALGLVFALSSASAIPIVGVYTWYKQSGDSCLEKLRLSLIPLKRRNSLVTTAAAPPIACNTASSIVVDYENRCGNDIFTSHPHINDVML